MTSSRASTKPRTRGGIAVVSGLAHNAMAPRGQRTQSLVEALGRRWDVELVALPAETFAGREAPVERRPLWRRAIGATLHSVLIDRWELWASRRLRGWRPEVDAALLIGYPWSPVTRAARRLSAAGIPYVVDAGDPWVITEMVPVPRSVAIWRSRRAEPSLWRGAAGAVLTTQRQAERLRQLFPELPILVRPNGYSPVPADDSPPLARQRDSDSLRLVHLGSLSPVRVDVAPVLAQLHASGRWREITFVQFGDDYVGMLNDLPAGVAVERHPARPWSEILARSSKFDVAVVLGNQLGYLLPSKAVQYLTLPIPRLAVTGGERDDALADYAERHNGWLVVTPGEARLAERLWDHLSHPWSATELAPPEAESWPNVAAEVSAFIERCVSAGATEPADGERCAAAPARGA